MELIPVTAPQVLPGFVACYAARLVGGDHTLHFAAGRECAARAIGDVLGRPSRDPVLRGAAGEPLWPVGVTGSITHTRDFVAAAAALSTNARSIGLDAEHITSPDRAARVTSIVIRPDEARLGELMASMLKVTLLFSIKEAAFKCLYPLVLKRFDYSALCVWDLDPQNGCFQAELAESLSGEFRAGYILSGRFQVEADRVYAGICLPAVP